MSTPSYAMGDMARSIWVNMSTTQHMIIGIAYIMCGIIGGSIGFALFA